MSDDDDKIVRVDFRVPRDPNAPDIGRRIGRPKARPACDHIQVEVDEHNGDVTCRACEAHVSPTVVLIRIARQEMNLHWTRDEARRLRKEIEALKAEERLIKARVRRARQAETRAIRALPEVSL